MKVILFDLDGTLIDSTEAILESFDVSYKAFGEQTPSEEDIKSLIGYPLDDMYKMLGISRDETLYVGEYKKHYRKISKQKTMLLPFALEAVSYAKENAILGVVTTKTARYSKELLEYFGLLNYFDVVIGREDVINPKPHAEPIQKAISDLKVDKMDVWMVGDTKLDLLSAKSAGVKSVGLLCGYGKEEDLKIHTNYIASNALEAVKIIKLN